MKSFASFACCVGLVLIVSNGCGGRAEDHKISNREPGSADASDASDASDAEPPPCDDQPVESTPCSPAGRRCGPYADVEHCGPSDCDGVDGTWNLPFSFWMVC